MKTWLKGGLIAVGIIAILFIFYYSIPNKAGMVRVGGENIFSIFFYILVGIFYPLRLLYSLGILKNNLIIYIALLALFGFYFFLGSLIGLIIQKIKSKKK